MGKLFDDDLENVPKCRLVHNWALESQNTYFRYWYCKKCGAKKETMT
jgi:hypothetical protein